MEESILTSIKKLLGITEEYEHFDVDIMIHINTIFANLNQMGVGPEEPFRIEDKTAVWSDFTSEKNTMDTVKTYVYLKVRLLFDPPTNGAAAESFKAMADEYEWRLNIHDDDWEVDDDETSDE